MLILLFWVFLFSTATDLVPLPNKLGGVIGLLSSILVLVFIVASPTSFYLAFESSLIPMALIVLGLGSQPERLSGTLFLWIYTVASRLPYFLVVLNSWSLWLYFLHGSSSFQVPLPQSVSIMLLLGFIAKAPLYGLHMWLPQTHVEASAFGSTVLAGILLKVGILGLIRVRSFLPILTTQLLLIVRLGGGALASFSALIQTDIKALIAYSRVAHIAVSLCGALSSSQYGSLSSLLMAVGHGAVSRAIFAIATVLYSTSGSRSILVNSGGLLSQSTLSNAWRVILVLNVSCPPYMSFISEIIIAKLLISNTVLLYPYFLLLMLGSLLLSLLLFTSFRHGHTFSKYPLITIRTKDSILGLIVIRTASIRIMRFLGLGGYRDTRYPYDPKGPPTCSRGSYLGDFH